MAAPTKVLLAYDGSESAKVALEDLARNRAGLPERVEVLALCVADVWTADRLSTLGTYGWGQAPFTEAQLRDLEAAQQQALKRARRTASQACAELKARCSGWSIRGESSSDAPAWGILKRAEEWGAELIAVGAHGRTALGRAVLGSVSQTVLREARCGVRVCRGPSARQGAPVCLIIGYDGSEDAEAAVAAAAGRRWPAASTARLVTAIDGQLSTLITLRRSQEAQARGGAAWITRRLGNPSRRLCDAGLSVTSVVRRGDPRAVLIEEAKRWRADGIFVGASGVRGIKRFLLGSVSSAVAAHAPCPVEVVRPSMTSVIAAPSRERYAATVGG